MEYRECKDKGTESRKRKINKTKKKIPKKKKVEMGGADRKRN